jgi:phenylalanyl-tRNA synthetase alpha chain
MPRTLDPRQLARDLAVRDLTDPAEGPHAVQAVVDLAVGALTERWRCAVQPGRGPRVVPIEDNYDCLGYEPAAVTRDARCSRYVDDRHMLRSHTSALVPAALRALAAAPVDDALLVCPGITYRRDAIDRLHTGTPHQLDLWRVSRRRLTVDDLEEMIHAVTTAVLADRPYRTEARSHPYTLEGRQIDVLAGGQWVEIGECGLAHPDVLAAAGLAASTGLAMGLGLDRLVMVRKGIADIRLLRAADPRVATQMLDLDPYRPVSTLPAVRRDLSVAVAGDETAEDIGDRVREALGHQADMVEEVAVLAETSYRDLPRAAVERLGIGPDQKNLLVRLVLRPYDETLTDADANVLRDRAYAALHHS